jgi:hypothetical protein
VLREAADLLAIGRQPPESEWQEEVAHV